MFHLIFQVWHPKLLKMHLISAKRVGVLIIYSSLFQIKCRGGKITFWWSVAGSEMNCAWDCECVSCRFTHTSLRLALAVACLALICYVSAPVPPSRSLMSLWLTAAVSELSGAPPLTTSCWRLRFSFPPIHLPPSGASVPINLNLALSRVALLTCFACPLPVSVVNSKTIVL